MIEYKLYVLMRLPVELIGIYRTENEALEAKKDYVNSSNEDEFYIQSDLIYL